MSFKDGRIGVGKDPIFPLDISGSARIDGDLVLGGRFSDSAGNPILLGGGSGATSTPEQNQNSVPSWSSSSLKTSFSGNVGIGIDPATIALNVRPSGNDNGIKVQTSTSNTYAYSAQFLGNSGRGLTVVANGAVGIGTTTLSNIEYNNLRIVGNNGNNGAYQIYASDAKYGIYVKTDNESSAYICGQFTGSTGKGLQIRSNGNAYFTGGNVGIGTTGPYVPLHASCGTFASTGENSPQAYNTTAYANVSAAFTRTNSNGGNTYGLFIGNLGNTGGTYLQNLSINNNAYYSLSLQPNGGNVGIGTSSPDHKLHIDGGDTGSTTFNDVVLKLSGTSSNNNGSVGMLFNMRYGASGAKSAIFSKDYAGTWNRSSLVFCTNNDSNSNDATLSDAQMVIRETGNVGIGTTSPSAKLTIQNTNSLTNSNTEFDKFSLYFDSNDTQKRNGMAWSYYSSFGAHLGITCSNTTADTLELWATNGRRVNICAPAGNETASWDHPGLTVWQNKVGIGTTSPAQLLDVNGHGWCRTLCVGSYDTFSGIDGGDGVKLQIGNSGYNSTFGIEFSGYTNGHRGGNQALAKILCKSNDSNNYENHYITFKVRGWGSTASPHHNPLNDRFWFYGSGNATASNWNTSSDDRVKHNERNITNAMNIINKLNAKLYFKSNDIKEHNYNYDLDHSGKPITDEYYRLEAGFIAQEVREIPELKYCVEGKEYVDDFENCFKKDVSGNNILDENNEPVLIPEYLGCIPEKLSLSYNDIFVYNVVATQELDKRVIALEKENQEKIETLIKENYDQNVKILDLYKENERLKARLEKIESFLGL